MLKNKDLAKKAFTDPVRSVLFIDDQFPTYEELTAAPPLTRSEAERARSLVSSCRRHHYVCDVQNDPDVLKKIEFNRIGVSDLIVVDYHLRGIQQHNDDVLNFLARLARSPHFNLVVLYTGEENLAKVRLFLAARLRGDAATLSPAESDPAVELPEISIEASLLETHIDTYLRSPRQLGGQVAALFPGDVATVNGLGARKNALIRRNFEPYLEEKLGTKNYDGPKNFLDVSMSPLDRPEQWVQAGNVFVAIVPKGTPEKPEAADIDILIQKLTECIVAWSPSLIDVMLTAAAGSVLRCGLRQLTADFADPNLRSGLVYWFLAGDSAYGDLGGEEPAADRRSRIEVLYRAVFEVLCNAALKQAADLSDEVVQLALGDKNPATMEATEHMALAKEWAKTNNVQDEGIVLAANCFLCASEFDGGHITTGTVFKRPDSDEYWLCVSAACDMVPRGKSINEWRTRMFPLRMMLGARLQRLDSPTHALAKATRGKHIFARINGVSAAFEFMNDEEPEPQLMPFFAGNAATVEDGKFSASLLTKGEGGVLNIEAASFEPIAQLRENYASRLLQQTGYHLSRIGVDFLKHPQAKAKSAKKATVTTAPPNAAKPSPDTASDSAAPA
jgi:hypothetical protein